MGLSLSTLKVYASVISAHHDVEDGGPLGKLNLIIRSLRSARWMNLFSANSLLDETGFRQMLFIYCRYKWNICSEGQKKSLDYRSDNDFQHKDFQHILRLKEDSKLKTQVIDISD